MSNGLRGFSKQKTEDKELWNHVLQKRLGGHGDTPLFQEKKHEKLLAEEGASAPGWMGSLQRVCTSDLHPVKPLGSNRMDSLSFALVCSPLVHWPAQTFVQNFPSFSFRVFHVKQVHATIRFMIASIDWSFLATTLRRMKYYNRQLICSYIIIDFALDWRLANICLQRSEQ